MIEALRTVEGKRCVVVGGAGFVGSNLTARLVHEGAGRVLVIDNLLSAERDSVPVHDSVEFMDVSVNSPDALAALADRPDFIFHLATYHGNQSSMHNPLADHENNLMPMLNICEAIKGSDSLEALVYSSAGCTVAPKTYDEAEATTEDALVSLYHDSPYQISKLAGEFYLNFYFLQHGVPGVKARFQNVYGPGEILGAGEWRGTPATVWRNVTPTFIYRALHDMPLRLDNGGQASRDFIYVDDIVEGLLRCATHGAAGEVFNLASGLETTIRELAETVIELTESQSELQLSEARPWDRSGRRFGSPDKAARELGFSAATSFRDGIGQTIDWTRASQGRIDQAIKRHQRHLEV